MKTHHLTDAQRYTIFVELQNGASQKRIAQLLNVHKSTISREIKRNCDQRSHQYRYELAIRKAAERKSNKPHFRRLTNEVEVNIVEGLLKE